MFNLHFKILDNVSKRQKSLMISFVRIFVKKQTSTDVNVVLENLYEELKYEVQLEKTDYFWVQEYFDSDDFYKDIRLLVAKYLQIKKQKQKQSEFAEKRKIYLKEVRRKIIKTRQSHEKPTAKQIKYYNYLCMKNGIVAENTADKSKLDLINLINGIINERSTEIQRNIQGNI